MDPSNNDEILLISKFENAPDKPGVYFFKDSEGVIIYVGKSKFLKRRLNSYFKLRETGEFSGTRDQIAYFKKLKELVSNISDVEFIVTQSEKEALLLENDMIKKYQPIYNAMMKDDKNFPWIVITYSEKFPRIRVIRAPRNQPDYDIENKLIGPYIDVGPMKKTLKILRKFFPYCSCPSACKDQKRACINYQMGLCPAPCANKITEEAYMENIKKLDTILSGDIDSIMRELLTNMELAKENLEYEKAAKNRDAIRALQGMIERQTIINYDNKANIDVLGYFKTAKKIGLLVLHIRDGRLSGKTPTIIETEYKMDEDSEIIYSFLEQFYLSENRTIPDKVILPLNGNDESIVKEYLESLTLVLQDKYNKEIIFQTNIQDQYIHGLLRIAQNNAKMMIVLDSEYERLTLESDTLKEMGMSEDAILHLNPRQRKALAGLKEIRDIFNLKELPKLIEGFDISTWKMGEAVGSMVQFVDGKPLKKNYRNFIIKNQTALGDSNMIHEVVYRRYYRQVNEKEPLPDLILVDGGKAQVNAAYEALEKLHIPTIPLVGLKKKSIHTQIEEAVFPDNREPIRLKDFSPGYNVLNQISQEYHRRAIQHHRKRIEKKMMIPKIDKIPGVGPKIRIILLDHFKTTEKVISASLQELQDLLGEKRGHNIYDSIRKTFKPKKIIKLRK
jgi:excinuclease ABC subunit C